MDATQHLKDEQHCLVTPLRAISLVPHVPDACTGRVMTKEMMQHCLVNPLHLISLVLSLMQHCLVTPLPNHLFGSAAAAAAGRGSAAAAAGASTAFRG